MSALALRATSLDAAETDLSRYRDILPFKLYHELPAVPIGDSPSTAAWRVAEELFPRIQAAPSYKPYKEAEKLFWLACLVHAAMRAVYRGGCVRFSRRHSQSPKVLLQVIDCARECGLLIERRSKPGSPKESRIIPRPKLRVFTPDDPDVIDPPTNTQFVQLFSRRSKREPAIELPFDPAHPVASHVQKCLELINAVNSTATIKCQVYDYWEERSVAVKQLRPIHVALFTVNFELHGRMYTDGSGHQRCREEERLTLTINGEPTVELDYVGMHPRLLYHRLGLDYPGDPYAFWGSETTKPQRYLAKLVFNTAINALSRQSAIRACEKKGNKRHRTGTLKSGKALKTARKIKEALEKTGLTFNQIYDLLVSFHTPIQQFINSGAGLWLMRFDSAIALDIMYHFAQQNVACLGIHDSFIVPKSYGQELEQVMKESYRKLLGFLPVVDWKLRDCNVATNDT